MPEIRTDLTTGNWAVLAPERSLRPLRELDRCPLCPGNEDLTPEATYAHLNPDGSWQVRVVPNKYPILHQGSNKPPAPARPAGGWHEVVIETPQHSLSMADMEVEEISLVLTAYQERLRYFRSLRGTRWSVVFRNCGRAAGSSLAHPHSQILSMPFVPPDVRRRARRALDHHRRTGTNIYADIATQERREGKRLVMEHDGLVVVVPHAPCSPFETWIMPLEQGIFEDLPGDRLRALAHVLAETLRGLRTALGDPPYNYVFQLPPLLPAQPGNAWWFVRIIPRLETPGGFETASGLSVLHIAPEEAAGIMKDVRNNHTARPLIEYH